jgi:hypothetical protein
LYNFSSQPRWPNLDWTFRELKFYAAAATVCGFGFLLISALVFGSDWLRLSIALSSASTCFLLAVLLGWEDLHHHIQKLRNDHLERRQRRKHLEEVAVALVERSAEIEREIRREIERLRNEPFLEELAAVERSAEMQRERQKEIGYLLWRLAACVEGSAAVRPEIGKVLEELAAAVDGSAYVQRENFLRLQAENKRLRSELSANRPGYLQNS